MLATVVITDPRTNWLRCRHENNSKRQSLARHTSVTVSMLLLGVELLVSGGLASCVGSVAFCDDNTGNLELCVAKTSRPVTAMSLTVPGAGCGKWLATLWRLPLVVDGPSQVIFFRVMANNPQLANPVSLQWLVVQELRDLR